MARSEALGDWYNDNFGDLAYDNHPYLGGFDDAFDSVQNYSVVWQTMDEEEKQQSFEEFFELFVVGGHDRDELYEWLDRMEIADNEFDWDSWREAYSASH